MDDWVELQADPVHMAREREKARALRKTAWWQRRVQKGLCAYCGNSVGPKALTMDHVVPVSRGGRSVRGNVVASCKECNNRKKLLTPAEQLLMRPLRDSDT
jgi:5-methylcytosine-specific restriction endonuclease McrA